MDAVLFNVHDVVLLLTVVSCGLAIGVFWQADEERKVFNTLVAFFFAAGACIPIDTLINFGAAVRPLVIENFPDIFFVFEYGTWIQAPLAYWLFRTLLSKETRFSRYDILLLLPFALSLTHQLVAYHTLPTDEKAAIQSAISIDNESVSVFFVQVARDAFRAVIAYLCLELILQFIARSSPQHAPKVPTEYQWLAAFGYGFFALNALSFLIASMLLVHVKFGFDLPIGAFGLAQNYFQCIFYLTIIVLYARSGLLVKDIKPQAKKSTVTRSAQGINPAYVSFLESLMKEEKVYTNHDLTLDLLSEKMGVSPRTLSSVINGYYGCNFFEYVNGYRIEEAKRLLTSEELKDTTVLDIMYEVGFNSKATFNGFFKKVEGLTPSEYRKQHATPAVVAN